MKYLIVKDKEKRNSVKKYELQNLSLKAFSRENFYLNDLWVKNLNDVYFPNLIKFYKNRVSFLYSHRKVNDLIKIRNRCVISGKSRSVSRRYKMSRIVLRDKISKGLLVGIKKKSW